MQILSGKRKEYIRLLAEKGRGSRNKKVNSVLTSKRKGGEMWKVV